MKHNDRAICCHSRAEPGDDSSKDETRATCRHERNSRIGMQFAAIRILSGCMLALLVAAMVRRHVGGSDSEKISIYGVHAGTHVSRQVKRDTAVFIRKRRSGRDILSAGENGEDRSLMEADVGVEDNEDTSAAFEEELPELPKLARSAEPVFVTINGKKYFGGLETLFHGSLTSKTCRILNACIRYDGTVLLPKWMQRYDDLLTFHCDLTKVLFILHDSQPPPSAMKDIDLFGATAPPNHMPSFFKAFLPNLISFDAVYNAEDRGTSRVCYTREGRGCSAGNIEPLLPGNIKPAVFLDSKLKQDNLTMSWPLQFSRLTAPKDLAKTRALFWSDMFPNTDEFERRCFKSLVISRPARGKEVTLPDLFMGLRFFTDNNIDKKTNTFSDGTRGVCNVNVTFMNRKPNPDQPDQLLSRYIPNIPEVTMELAKLSEVDETAGKISLTIHKIRTEGRSIKWQMNAMQRTDVLVAGHGSQLTNMVFMRNGASVLEIFPFTYYPQTFEKMAMYIANMRYDSLIAKPDPETFMKCMSHYYNNVSDPNTDAAHDVNNRYERALESYEKSDKNTHSLTTHGLDSSLSSVRLCAEMQRLETPVKKLASRIFAMAQASCKNGKGSNADSTSGR
jgi:hypothetical protein